MFIIVLQQVVLPAVARKMGLEDHYEEADGSPKQPRQSEEVIPPVSVFFLCKTSISFVPILL